MKKQRIIIVAIKSEDFNRLKKAGVLPFNIYTTWADFQELMAYKNALAVAREWGVTSGVRIARYFGFLREGEPTKKEINTLLDDRVAAGISEV